MSDPWGVGFRVVILPESGVSGVRNACDRFDDFAGMPDEPPDADAVQSGPVRVYGKR